MIGLEGAGRAGQAGTGLAEAQTTGRRVVVFAEPDGAADPAETLRSIAGVSEVASTRDFAGQAMDMSQIPSAGAIVFAELGVAVVAADADQAAALEAAASARGAILAVEPELVHYVLADADGGIFRGGGVSVDYVRGYRDGVGDLSGRIVPAAAGASRGLSASEITGYQDTDRFTWGLQATETAASCRSGQGVKVAVLDTGFDLAHPDFRRPRHHRRVLRGRGVGPGRARARYPLHRDRVRAADAGGQSPVRHRLRGRNLRRQGTRRPGIGRRPGHPGRYQLGGGQRLPGVVHVAGRQRPAGVTGLRGRREPGPRRGVAHRGRRRDNARRDLGMFGFVGVPANSPSIMAVAAADPQLDIAYFSARSNPVRGGQVDVAGPGVDVYSSWPMPTRYNTISGTSMATPHASGIAALWCQVTGRRAGDRGPR